MLAGAPDLIRDLRRAVACVRGSAVAARLEAAPRAWSGLRLTIAAGAPREVWLDLVFESATGYALLELVAAGATVEQAEKAAASVPGKIAALRRTEIEVNEAGLLYLEDGRIESIETMPVTG